MLSFFPGILERLEFFTGSRTFSSGVGIFWVTYQGLWIYKKKKSGEASRLLCIYGGWLHLQVRNSGRTIMMCI